jgi:cytoskeletal protein CcmA (bactofilin family)
MKKRAIFYGFLVCGLLGYSVAFAADVITATKDNPTVSVLSNETHKNVYTVGGTVSIEGSTMGDIVVAGGTVSLKGSVEQDVLAVGGTIDISGTVGGDVRAAGGTLNISNKINGDLLVAGGTVVMSDKAEIMGDVLIAGGSVTMNGPVHGSIKSAGGTIVVNNTVGGNMNIIANELSFGSGAKVEGKVYYKGKKEAEVEPGAQVGAIDFTKTKPSGFKAGVKSLVAGAILVKLIAWILAGLLLIRFRKQTVENVLAEVTTNPWKNLGLGIVGIIGLVIVIAICFFAFIGYYIGAVLAAWFILLVLISNLAGALVLGALIVRLLTKSVQSVVDWQSVVIGVVVLTLIKFIPVVGFIVGAVFFFVVLGSLLSLVKKQLSSGDAQV